MKNRIIIAVDLDCEPKVVLDLIGSLKNARVHSWRRAVTKIVM